MPRAVDCQSSRCGHVVPYPSVHLDKSEFENWVNFQKAKPKPSDEPEEVAGKCPHCNKEVNRRRLGTPWDSIWHHVINFCLDYPFSKINRKKK